MSRARWGLLLAVLFIIAGLFGAALPLSAQTGEPAGEADSPGPASGESAIVLGEAPALPDTGSGSSVFVVLRMVLVLAVSALAVYGVVFFIKRLARPRESRDPHLKVLARVPLGNDSFAAVVSVGAKAWLVGGGSGGVSLISEIDDAEALGTMLLDDARRSAGQESRLADLRSVFRRLGGAPRAVKGGVDTPGASGESGGGSGGDSGSPAGYHAENLRQQRKRLEGQ